jgi:Fic family protein
MSTEQLTADAPGEFIPYGKKSYYKPNPLPPEDELSLDEEFYETLSEATFWLGKLSGLGMTVEFPPVLYTSLLRKEAMESVEIEGGNVNLNAVFSAETRELTGEEAETLHTGPSNETMDTREVLNYEEALEYGIDSLHRGEEISIALLHTLHEKLLSGVQDHRKETDAIGEFKNKPNHIGEFLPAPPGTAADLMDALMSYIRAGGRYHPLVDIALVHYQLETIHPYGDGNGRVGRLLVTLQLYDAGYLERPTLYLSEYFNRNKPTYVARMESVRSSGDWEEWLSFFVRGVKLQAKESVARSIELRDLQQQYDQKFGDGATASDRLANNLFEVPYFTAPQTAEFLGVSRATAYRAIGELEEKGILEEVTGNDRNKEFRAKELFEILEQPPQTY